MAESDPEQVTSGAGHRLGAPETLGISTLDPGHRPPPMPPGRHVTIRVRMLDDTEELFDISVSHQTMGLLVVVRYNRKTHFLFPSGWQSSNWLPWRLHNAECMGDAGTGSFVLVCSCHVSQTVSDDLSYFPGKVQIP